MSASKAQQARTAARRASAIAMRLAGADLDTIAARLDYSSRAAVSKDITRALEANLADESRQVALLREQELARLDRLQVAVWPAAIRGDLDAVKSARELIDRRCKLLGLDAPARHEVFTYEGIDAEIARLEAEHAQKAALAAAAAAELGRIEPGEAPAD